MGKLKKLLGAVVLIGIVGGVGFVLYKAGVIDKIINTGKQVQLDESLLDKAKALDSSEYKTAKIEGTVDSKDYCAYYTRQEDGKFTLDEGQSVKNYDYLINNTFYKELFSINSTFKDSAIKDSFKFYSSLKGFTIQFDSGSESAELTTTMRYNNKGALTSYYSKGYIEYEGTTTMSTLDFKIEYNYKK